jgi:DNA modification methylase
MSRPLRTRPAVEVAPELKLQIELRPVASLRPSPNNPRRHSPAQITQIAASIKEFGFTNPLLIDADGTVIAGQGRLEAAKELGLTVVPVVPLAHLTQTQRRAYVIADNRLAEHSKWDTEILAIELHALMDLDFEIQLTGFTGLDLDQMLRLDTDEDEPPETDSARPPVSRLGDLWQLGDHRICCGDSLEPASYEAVLQGELAQVVFTDPPYNVRIDGHVTVGSKGRHGEFAMASGEMTRAQFTTFLRTVCTRLKEAAQDGAICFICMDWRHLPELLEAALPQLEWKNLCVWNKDNGGMGSLYRSKHELVLVFKHGTAAHINNVELGKHGRNRTNVWDYPGANSGGRERMAHLAMHPTVKPVAMIADALLDCSNRRGLVLDPFGGSGSTLLAAQRTGRRAALIELDPKYVDVAIRRFAAQTGIGAVLHGTEQSFDDVADERRIQEDRNEEA